MGSISKKVKGAETDLDPCDSKYIPAYQIIVIVPMNTQKPNNKR
jgi:hypothetical protein